MLAQLAAITGSEFDHERAKVAIQNARQTADDPLSQLVSAAAEVYMRVSPIRQPLAEVIWQAHHDTPVVIWHAVESRWIVITFAGWFRLRIAEGEHPEQRLSISRTELVRMLGLNRIDETVEAGIVHPERPAHGMSSHSGHHATEHDHISPVRRFFGLLKAEKQDIRTLLIFSIFAGILYLAAPLAVDAVVSNLAFGGQQQPYVQALIVLSIALFACLALQAIVTGFQYYISDIIQRRIFVRTASDLAYRLPRVKAEALDDVHAPELVNRFLDVVTVQKSTALLLLDGVNLAFSTLIGMLLLAFFHPVLLLFTGVMLVLIVLIIWLLGRGAVDTSIEESRMKYDLVNWYEEIAHFPFLFKGPGGYGMAYDRANQLASDYVSARSRHFRVLMRQIAGLLTLQVFAAAALLVVGGWLVISQQITLGQLVASELIMTTIVASLSKLGKKLEAWYDAMAAMDKLGHVVDLEIEREDGEQPTRREGGAEIIAKGLSFGYAVDAPLFDGRSFTIRPGARAAVVGPHGSGASSLLDILFGLRQPTGGFVSIDGLDLRSWYLEALREQVQLLRRDEIVDATVIENLRLGRPDIGMDEIRQALTRVGLLDDLLHRPDGLNLRLKIGGAPLSGNQRTRLLLARALVQRPRLLLIDELLDGLDNASFAQLSAAILDPSLPWTVVLTTRDHDVTRSCDQIIEISPCRLTDGTSSISETQRIESN
ncbi:ATP-binding cassette domain-containing protein [Prosthecobacter sp.]|uniref:peptidase domain-containing ABC transporter n=1 Tax=Prosthecobacter sp. TaxID=1965333 RepID=UPI001D79544D|nr:ATP-binding cassette domain-containing protein [Prosthecobacter sp.]MCB1279327.1 ATP-binding cassette domain-containing protein [Prosthecobacter sp.]